MLDNNVTNCTYGVLVTGDNTTAGITISGGTLTDDVYGVDVTDNDPQFASDGNTPNAVVSGVTIAGATGAGIFVEEANGQTVCATIEGNTSISGGSVGILVSGAEASLAFSGTRRRACPPRRQLHHFGKRRHGRRLIAGRDRRLERNLRQLQAASVLPASDGSAYAVEDKITDYLDDPKLGYVSLQPTTSTSRRAAKV